MPHLRIKNFGPIKDGFTENNGFMEISPMTVICGNQATGKSTIAKLYSTFTWLEKALQRGDFFRSSVTISKLKNSYFQYLNIGSYFQDDTEIDFIGELYKFHVSKNEKPVIEKVDNPNYIKAKIEYIPAERNLISTFPNVEKAQGLLRYLFDFLDEFDDARVNTPEIRLPIGNFVYKYDKTKHKSFITTTENDFRIELFEASSGIQSVTPLTAVSQYYSKLVNNEENPARQRFSLEEKKEIEKEYRKLETLLGVGAISSILGAFMTGGLSLAFSLTGLVSVFSTVGLYNEVSKKKTVVKKLTEEQVQILKDANDKILSLVDSRFINIVEEPEQNLYPESQGKVLYELLKCLNSNKDNQLIITTHSPYILSYLTLSAKAAELLSKKVPANKIEKIVPEKSAVDGKRITIYETNENGSIIRLSPYENLPSDDNLLNKAMAEGNEKFAELLDLEQEYCS
ncbi:MAG: AAA family ATPase [Treponema sp.]|nr:AAA family ATPase [Treponema sp.]